ncbi:hypothetical protein WR164_12540 [Philodulcilactobacillus myokoensis]|uniref:Uncharacterized protein n=1 Tax=Philodulcilactobacillus myokoensis TaxID=2929573 RepID=A0A9W6B1P5_9LACO|nr:hypothetical protein [Philodulcilactobacillus myokoensis]GLB47275.1 hypothetical protein WR164_12540 [Philodulcilactobacillus myokoensis]
MSIFNAHPTKITSQNGNYQISANKAAKLFIANKYPDKDAFTCGKKNVNGNGYCSVKVILCAVNSKHVKPYFRQKDLSEKHTCNIKIDPTRKYKGVHRRGKHIYVDDKKGILNFFKKSSAAKNKPPKSVKKVSNQNKKTTNAKTIVDNNGLKKKKNRHYSINTLEKIVDNKNTIQLLPSKTLFNLNKLFFKITNSNSKTGYGLPQNMFPIFYGNAYLYQNNKVFKDHKYKNYHLFFPNQLLNGKNISIILYESEIKTLLSKPKSYVVNKNKNGNKISKKKLLKVYTTIEPQFSKLYNNYYVDVKHHTKDNNYLKNHIYIRIL